jgi:hypothetical protein
MKLPLIIAVLALAGCAQLTGDPAKDCLAATNMLNTAQAGATIADAIASSNPQSERMQQAAALAKATLEIAVAQRAAACPAI